MKEEIIEALQAHLEGHIAKHRLNVRVMLENPMAIHDHTDLLGAIELELEHIAEYMDKLEALGLVLS
jgi:replication initiation and membrane attachment protein DnaB